MKAMNMILESLSDGRREVDDCVNKYKIYYYEHVKLVKEAYNELFLPLLKSTDDVKFMSAILQAGVNINQHDLSKLSVEEFPAYRYRFYPTRLEKADKDYDKKVKDIFDKAWTHHHQNNKHHPLYWCEDGVKKDMPLEYIIEMICDWVAVSKYFHTSTLDWYNKEADDEKRCFTDSTREIVDDVIFNILRGKIS